jgi:uncharacterized lipoprotein YajG
MMKKLIFLILFLASSCFTNKQYPAEIKLNPKAERLPLKVGEKKFVKVLAFDKRENESLINYKLDSYNPPEDLGQIKVRREKIEDDLMEQAIKDLQSKGFEISAGGRVLEITLTELDYDTFFSGIFSMADVTAVVKFTIRGFYGDPYYSFENSYKFSLYYPASRKGYKIEETVNKIISKALNKGLNDSEMLAALMSDVKVFEDDIISIPKFQEQQSSQ